MEEVTFSIATHDDLAGMIDLTNRCFDETTPLEYAERIWNETSDDPNQIYLNGWKDGKIVAHTKITIIPTIYEDMNTYAILNHVCVDCSTKFFEFAMNVTSKRLSFGRRIFAKRPMLYIRSTALKL